MNRNKLLVLNCVFITLTILLFINSIYFMVVADDLSKKVIKMEQQNCKIDYKK